MARNRKAQIKHLIESYTKDNAATVGYKAELWRMVGTLLRIGSILARSRMRTGRS